MLKEAGRTQNSMIVQESLANFLGGGGESAYKFNGLVEDIRKALISYQVCTPKRHTFIAPNVCQTSLQRGTYEKNCQEIVSSISIQSGLPLKPAISNMWIVAFWNVCTPPTRLRTVLGTGRAS